MEVLGILMATPYELNFTTRLAATTAEAWIWMTSFEGISREMSPYLHMSAPAGVKSLQSVPFTPGKRLFRSWITLFHILPFDYSDLTLVSIEEGIGFVEQSPMGTMRLWRHERRISPIESGCSLSDTLTFEPRFAGPISRWIVAAFFRHRHRQLARYLGGSERAEARR